MKLSLMQIQDSGKQTVQEKMNSAVRSMAFTSEKHIPVEVEYLNYVFSTTYLQNYRYMGA